MRCVDALSQSNSVYFVGKVFVDLSCNNFLDVFVVLYRNVGCSFGRWRWSACPGELWARK